MQDLNSDEQREDRWSRLAANERQLAVIHEIEASRGVRKLARRDTALPHLEVHTLDGARLRVWPSGVTDQLAPLRGSDYYGDDPPRDGSGEPLEL